jgi:hypothetical protein
MDEGLSTGTHLSDGLRERNIRTDSTVSREALTAMGEVEVKDKDGKELKTFGRTPDGTGKLATAIKFIYFPGCHTVFLSPWAIDCPCCFQPLRMQGPAANRIRSVHSPPDS